MDLRFLYLVDRFARRYGAESLLNAGLVDLVVLRAAFVVGETVDARRVERKG